MHNLSLPQLQGSQTECEDEPAALNMKNGLWANLAFPEMYELPFQVYSWE